MARVDLDEHETAALIDLLAGAIEQDPFPESARSRRLRGILAKLRPLPEMPSQAEAATDDELAPPPDKENACGSR